MNGPTQYGGAVRIQRRRSKGWRMPEGAVYVGRPTKWGNPFRVGDRIDRDDPLSVYIDIPGGWGGLSAVYIDTAAQAVDAYWQWILNRPSLWVATSDDLAGHDLVCWCPLDQPCHADVLLQLANTAAAGVSP